MKTAYKKNMRAPFFFSFILLSSFACVFLNKTKREKKPFIFCIKCDAETGKRRKKIENEKVLTICIII